MCAARLVGGSSGCFVTGRVSCGVRCGCSRRAIVLNACCAGTNVTVRAPLQASMHSDTYHKLQFVIGGDAVAPTTVVARDQRGLTSFSLSFCYYGH